MIDNTALIQGLNWISHYENLDSGDLDSLMQKMDVGVGPCALERQGLTESCSLKVSYYLSQGIPTFSFYPDSRNIPSPAYFMLDEFDPNLETLLINYLLLTKNLSRRSIFQSTESYWSHRSVLNTYINQLNKLL